MSISRVRIAPSMRQTVRRTMTAMTLASGIVVGATGASASPLWAQQVATSSDGASTRARDAALLARRVTVEVNGASLKQAIDLIANAANVKIGYQHDALAAYARAIRVHAVQQPLGALLDTVLAGTRLAVVVTAEDAIVLRQYARLALVVENGVIVGRVTDAKTKQPLSGVAVLLDDETKGVVTDADGTFRLTAAPGTHTVRVRRLGMTRQSKQVAVTDGQTSTVDFALEASTSVLNEVVVTGSVVATERKAITTPITVLTAADLEKRNVTRIDQLFRGEVPGVIALDFGTQRYDGTTLGAMVTTQIYTRGSSNLVGGANPLKTYVDGIEIVDPSYLGTIDPKSIEKIEIITGPQAATIYGSGAMGGVMQIFTKKGSGSAAPDVTMSLRYGMLESNINDSRTPTHADAMSVTGGNGPLFTYSVNASYNYSGQWQPKLFSRGYGMQLGVTHENGALTASGSYSYTAGKNGTAYNPMAILFGSRVATGEFSFNSPWLINRPTVSTSLSQIAGFNVDYRISRLWQHHLTLGTTQTNFDLVPRAPMYGSSSDSLYANSGSTGRRTSVSYNTTFMPSLPGMFTGTLILGATGALGRNTIATGSTGNSTQTSWVSTTVIRSMDDKSAGGFASARLGIADRLFLTASLRGEGSPYYGTNHSIDWTPTVGATYTIEAGDLTLKALASYGRATRAPNPNYRLSLVESNPDYTPSQYFSQYGNQELTPEYESGPQGGIELYYGNVGSLSVNHYNQRVTNLILPVIVDSFAYVWYYDGQTYYNGIQQYQNLATVRQTGWEGVGTLNFGPLSFRGVYSWNDSRIQALSPKYRNYPAIVSCSPTTGQCFAYPYTIGAPFVTVPTHSGSGQVSYAVGGTTVSVVSNWIGAGVRNAGDDEVLSSQANYRLQMYVLRRRFAQTPFTQPGYVKTDMAVSQRVSRAVTATLNVTNLGNSTQGEGSYLYPTLGRQTQLGLSVRLANLR